MLFRALGWLSFALVASVSLAQTLYVSDELRILLRTGPSTRNSIIRELPAGTLVDVLERTPNGEYARVLVRDQRAGEGWVLMQYLTPEPIARDKLAAAERDLTQARARMEELEQEVLRLEEALDSAQQELGETQAAHASVSAELDDVRALAAAPLELREQNNSLRRRVNELDQEVALLSASNAELANRTRQNWFIIGATVLLAGIVLGLLLPHLKRRKRSSW